MGRPNGRSSGRSFCRPRFPSSWRASGSRSVWAIIGIIVAEFFTAISGLGGMIVEYANVFATAKLFVPIIVIAIVGVVLTELVMWLERRMSRWRQLERERF
jgi:ABC-type nitrate/sulfonate/bicarbonate transport system permease component